MSTVTSSENKKTQVSRFYEWFLQSTLLFVLKALFFIGFIALLLYACATGEQADQLREYNTPRVQVCEDLGGTPNYAENGYYSDCEQ